MLKWFPLKNQEFDKFTVEVELINKGGMNSRTYPHELIKLAEKIVLDVINKKPTNKAAFDLANKKLWFLAEALDVWLGQKEDPNQQDSEGNMPFHLICEMCKLTGSLHGLSSREKSNNRQGYETCTVSKPIAYMFVKLLQVTNINSQNKSGDTPLHLLAKISCRQLEFNPHLLMIVRSADVAMKNNKGESPLDLACYYSPDSDLSDSLSLYNGNKVLWKDMTAKFEKEIIEGKIEMDSSAFVGLDITKILGKIKFCK